MNFASSPLFVNFRNKPNTIAAKIYIIDIDAAEAPGIFCEPSLLKPLNVPARINAAMTNKVNSQQNSRNNFLPVLPIYRSMMRPIDLPSFLTDAYSAVKS